MRGPDSQLSNTGSVFSDEDYDGYDDGYKYSTHEYMNPQMFCVLAVLITYLLLAQIQGKLRLYDKCLGHSLTQKLAVTELTVLNSHFIQLYSSYM